jgi:hypothetical protein
VRTYARHTVYTYTQDRDIVSGYFTAVIVVRIVPGANVIIARKLFERNRAHFAPFIVAPIMTGG